MEDQDDSTAAAATPTSTPTHYYWASASAAQLGYAVYSVKRGYAVSLLPMPLKAFGVASLFVGAGATASLSLLTACGIHKIEDLLEVGANIRSSLGVRPRRTE